MVRPASPPPPSMARAFSIVHGIDCGCQPCTAEARADARVGMAAYAFTRVLFLMAALIAIPFVIARALASAKGDRR